MMEKIIVVVKGGMVQDVYGTCPHKFEVEVIDFDLDGAEPTVVEAAEERLQTVKQLFFKIY